MSKTYRIIISLMFFVVMQLLFVAMFYLQIRNDLMQQYRDGVEYNFNRTAQYIETNVNNLDEVVFSEIYVYNFNNVMLVAQDGYINRAVKEADGFVVGGVFGTDDLDFVTIANESTYRAEVVIAGNRTLLFSKKIGSSVLVAYESLTYQANYISTVFFKMMTVQAVQALLMSLLLFLYNSRSAKKLDSLSKFDATDIRYMVFYITRKGTLTHNKGNSLFLQKHQVENISDYVTDTEETIAKALSERLPFNLLVPDRNGEQSYYRCLSNRTSSGYRVLAIDDSAQYFESKRLSEQILQDQMSGLRNKSGFEMDLAKCFKTESREQRAVAIFNLKNLENIEALFSAAIKEEVLKNCARLFKEKFGHLGCGQYLFNGNKMAILCHTTDLTETVKLNMHEFNSSINSVVRIGKNDIQILTDAVFLYLNNVRDDISLEEIIEYTDYLVLNTKTRMDASFVTDIFSKSKYYHAIGNKKEITKKIIDENRFHLFFQPQFRISDGKLVAFEALVRLDEISLTTQDFILISEVNGYMLQLGDAIMRKAFEFAQMINRTGIVISINLSPIQLLNKGFVDNFLNKYGEFTLNSNSIALEITETFLMSDVTENIKKIKILHEHGIMVHLDDFGMGYSSLAYLQNFPVDVIKIDKEFVSNIEDDDYNRAICNFIISTAKHLKIETIAEGVERPEQLQTLKIMGCDTVQGYLTGKPMSVDNAIKLIESNRGGRA